MKTIQQLDSEIRHNYEREINNCGGDWNQFSFQPIKASFFGMMGLTIYFDDQQFTGLCAKLECFGAHACLPITTGTWEPVITDNFCFLDLAEIMEELESMLATDIKRCAIREAFAPIRDACLV